MTVTLSLSEAKIKLSKLVHDVIQRDDEIIITRNGKPVAVLINAQEYESWKETQEILENKELMREIQEGLDAVQKGKAKKYTLDELFGPDLK